MNYFIITLDNLDIDYFKVRITVFIFKNRAKLITFVV